VDIFDHVTSLARASRSSVNEPARPLHTGSSISVSRRLPVHFDAPSVALLWNQLCLKTSLWTECRPTLNKVFKREFLLRYQWNVFQLLLVPVQSCVHSYLRIPWISLISFGYIEVDFVVGGWISWISLFRQWISLIRQWISWQWLDFVDFVNFAF